MPKINLTPYSTMTNNNEQRTTNFGKQTQTKPILSACAADKIVPSAVEGPIRTTSGLAGDKTTSEIFVSKRYRFMVK